MKKNITSILLLAGIIVFANLISRQFYTRLDATQNRQYTLSTATKNILKDLEEPILVKAFFTGDLPQQYQKPQQDFQNLLIEYANRSGGMVDYQFIDPSEDENEQRKAVEQGVSPLLINVRDKDQNVQKRAFMGAVVESGALKDVIPFVQPEGPMEYQLTTAIKKVSQTDKPAIAIVQGHGEVNMQNLSQAVQTMSVLYNVEQLDLNTATDIPIRFKTIVIIKPTDTIPPADLNLIDDYMSMGGNVFIAADWVDGNFQTVQGTSLSVGLDSWLNQKGLNIDHSFVIDSRAGSVSVQQQQGFFRFNTAVQFPFFPMVSGFGDHPVTKGIEQVVFQFASPIRYRTDTSTRITPLVQTSNRSGIVQAPTYFDINKQWSKNDFPVQAQTIAALVQEEGKGDLIVFSDGDFAVGAQDRGQNPDNISLLVNAVDYLSDDTGLIDLRTKGVTSRPIKEMEESEMTTIKYLNFFFPILLVIGYGLFRFSRNRRRRQKLLHENWED